MSHQRKCMILSLTGLPLIGLGISIPLEAARAKILMSLGSGLAYSV